MTCCRLRARAARTFALRPILTRLRALLAAALMLAALPAAAESSYDASLTLLAQDNFARTIEAVRDVAASGDPRAPALLEALRDGRLTQAGGRLFIATRAGGVVDAATGAPASAPPDAAPVRINNRVRGALEAALGSLTLLSSDVETRRAAAQSIFRSRDQAARPALAAALAQERDASVRDAMGQALAVLTLTGPTPAAPDALAAIEILRQRGDQDSLTLLDAAAAQLSAAGPKAAATAAADHVRSRLKIAGVVQTIWYGLSLGSVLLLAAIGLSITFGVMGVINMAHGEMVMLGAYATFLTQQAIGLWAPGLMGWSLAISIVAAFLLAGAAGLLIELLVVRRFYGRPLETLLATFGVSLILQQAVRTLFGPTNREVTTPAFMSGAFDLFGVSIGWGRLWIIVFALLVFTALLTLLRATPLGLRMRAVTQNRRMAAAMGIRTSFVDAATFALGSGVAGVAGVALSQIDNVSPNLGQSYIIDSFMVVVFGGVGSLWGTLASAFALGVGSKLLEPALGAVLAKIAILVALILFIQKKPAGLFAPKGRAVEA
jgi:urea transport system permease protein